MSPPNQVGQRGKKAEKLAQVMLDTLNLQRANFAYLRLPDARAAMGRMKAMPADYLVFTQGRTIALEVKQSEHSYRLARDKLPQLAVLRKLQWAGVRALVLLYHSVENCWRSMDLSAFDGDIPPSWDLSEYTTYPTAREAFDAWWREYG